MDGCHFDHERALHADGFGVVAGIDEAGRGPLAGPVVAAAVILPHDFRGEGIDDSKKLTATTRARLYEVLTGNPAVRWSSARADVDEIDRLNILRATHLAMRRAAETLPVAPDCVLIDGLEVRDFPIPQRALVGGDAISLSIAAASIIAKVERDAYMTEMSRVYPRYGFEAHKGYGTKRHLACLREYGPCPIHRRSFRPVAQLGFSFDDD